MRNVSFLEARKIISTYMGENSYASVTRRLDTINQDNKYRALVVKLIQLEPNDWPKFKEQLKNLHSAELQTQPRPVGANKKKSQWNNQSKITNQPTNPTVQTQTTPPKRKSPAKLNSHRSPTQPFSCKLDNPNLKLNYDKPERSPLSKMNPAPSSTRRERQSVHPSKSNRN